MDAMNAAALNLNLEEVEEEEDEFDERLLSPAQRLDNALGLEDTKGATIGGKKKGSERKPAKKGVKPRNVKPAKKPPKKSDKPQIEDQGTKIDSAMLVDTILDSADDDQSASLPGAEENSNNITSDAIEDDDEKIIESEFNLNGSFS